MIQTKGGALHIAMRMTSYLSWESGDGPRSVYPLQHLAPSVTLERVLAVICTGTRENPAEREAEKPLAVSSSLCFVFVVWRKRSDLPPLG